MLTGELRSQVDSVWNDFWAGGVSNPLSVIEQITFLLFIKRLDELHEGCPSRHSEPGPARKIRRGSIRCSMRSQ